ncbi:MAG TPA: GNAT family N-acetyltransferase [Anaerolineaceae bacterium]
MEAETVTFLPVTAANWADFETMFGANGACAGCWCMWWRLTRAEWTRQQYEPNHQAMRALVDAGHVPGILAYRKGQPVGWCSVAPRAEFPSLDRSQVLFPVDDLPVWSIVCFYIKRGQRRNGLSGALVQAAVDWARQNGAPAVEAYPVDSPATFSSGAAFTGWASTFRRAGFIEVARRSPTRPVMRLDLTVV